MGGSPSIHLHRHSRQIHRHSRQILIWVVHAGALIHNGFADPDEDLFAPDVVFHFVNPQLPALAGDHHGYDGVRSLFERLEQASDTGFHNEPHSATPYGDEFVVAFCDEHRELRWAPRSTSMRSWCGGSSTGGSAKCGTSQRSTPSASISRTRRSAGGSNRPELRAHWSLCRRPDPAGRRVRARVLRPDQAPQRTHRGRRCGLHDRCRRDLRAARPERCRRADRRWQEGRLGSALSASRRHRHDIDASWPRHLQIARFDVEGVGCMTSSDRGVDTRDSGNPARV